MAGLLTAINTSKALIPVIGAALMFAAGFTAAEAYEHKVPWGLSHKLASAQAEASAWRHDGFEHEAGRALGWAMSFAKAESLRRGEHGQAVAAVTADQRACDARVAQARRSTLAIQSLVSKEVPRDPQGCPVRQLVDPRELRDALHPPAPAG